MVRDGRLRASSSHPACAEWFVVGTRSHTSSHPTHTPSPDWHTRTPASLLPSLWVPCVGFYTVVRRRSDRKRSPGSRVWGHRAGPRHCHIPSSTHTRLGSDPTCSAGAVWRPGINRVGTWEGIGRSDTCLFASLSVWGGPLEDSLKEKLARVLMLLSSRACSGS